MIENRTLRFRGKSKAFAAAKAFLFYISRQQRDEIRQHSGKITPLAEIQAIWKHGH